jgi:hypothetical protein
MHASLESGAYRDALDWSVRLLQVIIATKNEREKNAKQKGGGNDRKE